MGGRYIRRRMGFAEERALLHLLHATEAGEADLHALTQEGIGGAIRSGRSTVAKALLRLHALDLIDARREHVPGHRLRKHVYRLSPEGWEEAARLRAEFGRRVVCVEGPDGEVRVRLGELPSLFPGSQDLSAIVARIHRGAIDAASLSTPPEEPCLPTAWGLDLPRASAILGRERESAQLDTWLRGEPRPLFVVGLPGIGKTALLAAAAARWRERYAVFWVAVRPWSSAASLAAEVAKFLSAIGRRSLEQAVADRGRLPPEAFLELLQVAVRGLRAVFVFDDVQAARPTVRRWLGLVGSALGAGPARLVLVGRASPRVSMAGAPRPVVLGLGPLGDAAAREILRGHATDPSLAESIVRAAGGNPLLLILGGRAGVAGPREIDRFLGEEVWSGLTQAERRSLEAVACFRRGAPLQALLSIRGIEADVLHRLDRRGLLGRTATGAFTVHPTIEAFVSRQTSARHRRSCHAAAARYFLSTADPSTRLEAVHHALAAGTPNVAADFLRREGERVFNSVSFAALRDVLAAVDPAGLPPAVAAVLLEGQGDVLRREGALRPAVARYDQALRQAREGPGDGDRARFLRKLGEVDRMAGRYEKARQRLSEAGQAAARAADPREAANIHRELALVEMARGDMGEAERHLGRALRAARAARDPARFARTLLVYGTLEATRGRREVGLERKRLALRHAESSGELAEIARVAISLGVSFAEMKRFEDALPQYEKGLRIARLLGDARLCAIGELDRASALSDLGRWSEARPAFDSADGMAQIVGEKTTRAFIAIGRGQVDMASGRWRRAADGFESGLQLLRDNGSPYEIARALSDVGGYYADHGDRALAEERWLEGLDLARTMKNAALVKELGAKLTLASPVQLPESSKVGGTPSRPSEAPAAGSP